MSIRDVRNAEVTGKRVLVRVDFNVELDAEGDVKERYKIAAAKETIDFLVAQGAIVAMATHLGRPEGAVVDEFSVRRIADDAERILGRTVRFVPDCTGGAVVAGLDALAEGEVLLLENVRFHAGDEANNPEFARSLAGLFELFVNDAFSVCHRNHASVTGVAKLLPSFAGIHLVGEVDRLMEIRERPKRPAVAVVGGAKIETKLPVIRVFEEKYDAVLVGSKISCEGRKAGTSFAPNTILPEDYTEGCGDIGPETINRFVAEIARAGTVVWNGPLGRFEEEEHARGTRAILEAIVASDAFTVVGGGETVIALEEAGVFDRISFVSTGGGAMLDFLVGTPMPGLDVLEG